ncbi:MAG: imidazole glycerol phosphate synthase subunit HisH [Candidatus Marinimicrobia bacterium]|nr:imidazole glycerol phosphate synthase subunit HisH [Candidatus Neomarinimicrobiota bacterium]
MIGLVNYGMGNIGSVGNALDSLDAPFIYSANPDELGHCQRLILPGVGAFGPAIERIRQLGLDKFLQAWAADGKPLLGICLGMQLLLDTSYEHGAHKGLNLIPGEVRKITGAERDVHMGWNQVDPLGGDPLMPQPGYGYFVHSFHCVPASETAVIGLTDFGGSIAAAIRTDNVMGVQFHPEKSQAYGLALLERYAHGRI